MLHVVTDNLQQFLTTYGYWAVFLFVAIESTGIPFPGESMLLVAAIYAGNTHRLSIVLVIVAAACGAILGDTLGFLVGRDGAAFLAGVNRMLWRRFLLYNALGGIAWATIYGLGGYLLGKQINRLTGPVGTVSLVLAIVIIIVSVIFVWRNERHLEDVAEAALPGPIEKY
ncbi:MAG: DedA family protein [Ktedonobacteraceae bacterium]